MKHAITNTGKNPMYVGSIMIAPGDTRHFDLADVPAHLRPQAPKPEPEPPEDPIAELLAKSAKDVITAIPTLSDEDLGKIETAEKAGAARKTVLAAIADETLQRAGGEG